MCVRRIACVAVVLGAAACSTVPFDAPRTESTALPPSRATKAGRAAAPWFDSASKKSGIVPLVNGEDALGARLQLIEEAEQSVDIQYFLIKKDISAMLIVAALIEAADRGVRIRVLFDDVFTSAPDEGLAIIDAHPGIEVRLFNPVARGGPQWLNFLGRMPDSNRRMHNKSFTVDGAISIVGGRNIADEYYAVEQDIDFADFDVVVMGPAAVSVSKTFDQFWNSKRSVPVAGLFGSAATDSAVARGFVYPDDATIAHAESVYDEAVESDVFSDLESGRIKPLSGTVRAISDPPAKLGNPVGSGLDILYGEIRTAIENATSEVVIVSPYFVPQRSRVDLLKAARARGVRVSVITNSLASNNHAYVHGGYFPYRRELLEAGVELYEAKVDSGLTKVTGEPAQLTLHTKAVIVDRRTAFIGSLNMDPRSIDLNSEMKFSKSCHPNLPVSSSNPPKLTFRPMCIGSN